MILRKDLQAALSAIRPALGGDKSLVPVHPCFCLTGTDAFSFDDTAAMHVPLKTPWKGAVRGEVLLAWLNAAGGKEVEATAGETGIKLKCGRGHAEFPILPEDSFLFTVPDLGKAPKVLLNAEGMKALRQASLAMGTDGQHPWRCGVQLIMTKEEITFFASDDASAARTWAKAQVPKALDGQTPLLPPRFVNLLLQNAAANCELRFSDEWFAASLANGVTLYSAIPGNSDVAAFQEMFARVPDQRKEAVPLPKTWWGAIARASVLLAGEREAPAMCKVDDKKMVIETLSSLGSSRDSFKFEKLPATGWPEGKEITAKLMPAIASKVKDEVSSFVIVGEPVTFAFFGDGFDFLIAAGS